MHTLVYMKKMGSETERGSNESIRTTDTMSSTPSGYVCTCVCVCLHMVAWDLGKYNLETGSLVCTFCEKISSLEP